MKDMRKRHFMKICMVLIAIIFLIATILHRKTSFKYEGYFNLFMKKNELEMQFSKNVELSLRNNNEYGEFYKSYDNSRNIEDILPWKYEKLEVDKYSKSQLNTEVETDMNLKIKNKSIEHDFLRKFNTSNETKTWEYNWDGENIVLIKDKRIVFSENYRRYMKTKLHHMLHNYLPFKKRSNNIEKYCNLWEKDFKNSSSLEISGRRIIFVDKFELLACNIPKASSTTLTQIFMRMDQGLSDDEKPNGPMGSKANISMSNIPMENDNDNARRVQTYTKIVLTRHPFSLIGSKYHFKVSNTAEDKFQRETCPEIIKKLYLKEIPTDEDAFIQNREKEYGYLNDEEFSQKLIQIRRLKAGPGKYNITLLEYIKSILNKNTDELVPTGQTLMCNPCAVRYDAILHYSNVNEEANVVLDYIQREVPLAKRVHYPDHSPLVSQKRCNEEFSQIPIEIRKKLHDFFIFDFLLFGYHFEDNPQNLNACY